MDSQWDFSPQAQVHARVTGRYPTLHRRPPLVGRAQQGNDNALPRPHRDVRGGPGTGAGV
jgi:hypothetical protein